MQTYPIASARRPENERYSVRKAEFRRQKKRESEEKAFSAFPSDSGF
jgi:hypothetical protein